MQYGNRYSVHTSSYGWCTELGEFKTLEEAHECFYKKISDEVEEQNPDHQRRFYVYMLEWSKDLSYHKEIRCWSVEEGYKIDFPKKPKSIFKILKQLYIKHKVETRRRNMSKLAESIVDSGKGGVHVIDEMLDDMKTLKECINDLQKDCEGATMMYKDLCKAKEIIKKLLALHFSPLVTQDDLKKQDEIIRQAQDFIKI